MQVNNNNHLIVNLILAGDEMVYSKKQQPECLYSEISEYILF